MNEFLILHEMLLKTQIVYPVLAGIIAFSIYEMILEYHMRKEYKNE
ncbi:hypothetical protein [Gudongella sp. DL1XJH-153]